MPKVKRPKKPAKRVSASRAKKRAANVDVSNEFDPTVYYTKPLETWTFRELHDALGTDRTAWALKTSPGNVRMLRHRGTATVERMQKLQAAVRFEEKHYRNTLVTLYATGAFRRQAH